MTIKELNNAKLPIVKIDKKLNKGAEEVLFPEKLEKANEALGSAGLPTSSKTFPGKNGSRDRKSVRPVRT